MSSFLCVSQLPHFVVLGENSDNIAEIQSTFADSARVICHQFSTDLLDFLSKNDVDVILIEHFSPIIDAFSTLKTIRSIDYYAKIPIFVLISDIDSDILSRLYLEHVTGIIPLPINKEILRNRVLEALRNKYLQDNLTKEVTRQVRLAEERLNASRKLFKEMSLALAKAIDAKDKYTSGHSERVANYSREIARRAGESEIIQEKIYFIGLLHDVGKIGIPRYIINKPSKLSEEEYNKIKQHPVIGSGILKSVDVIPEFAIGAHYHHERYDGKGYPQGLKGDEIPKIARIITVADAYDAMTSKRSYRDSLAQEVVRAEIVRERGLQFDPKYADIILQMIDEDTSFQMREQTVSPLVKEASLQLTREDYLEMNL
ncbi:MAG: HD domain-containing protein [Desulfovibrio sp.]|nr:HD domain-containing protein [Desulfovibrio sp.]